VIWHNGVSQESVEVLPALSIQRLKVRDQKLNAETIRNQESTAT